MQYPSRSDKDAYEVAKVWVNCGHSVATKELNAVAKRNKLTKCETVMLADKVRHHHWVLLDKTNGII